MLHLAMKEVKWLKWNQSESQWSSRGHRCKA